jgi:hypothetical protein
MEKPHFMPHSIMLPIQWFNFRCSLSVFGDLSMKVNINKQLEYNRIQYLVMI